MDNGKASIQTMVAMAAGAVVMVAIAMGVVSLLAGAQQQTPNDVSGAVLYQNFCASCHGADGKGGGPAAPALKKAPPDLTLLSKKNKGQFPDFRVTHIIDGYEIVAYHGSRGMPIWGDFFRDMQRDETMLKLREHNLTEYIRSLQQ